MGAGRLVGGADMTTSVRVCTVDLDELGACPSGSEAWVAAMEVIPPADMGITPATLLQVYGWGLAAVLLFFFIGLKAGAALGVIRRV